MLCWWSKEIDCSSMLFLIRNAVVLSGDCSFPRWNWNEWAVGYQEGLYLVSLRNSLTNDFIVRFDILFMSQDNLIQPWLLVVDAAGLKFSERVRWREQTVI